jgi:EpsI family protein
MAALLMLGVQWSAQRLTEPVGGPLPNLELPSSVPGGWLQVDEVVTSWVPDFSSAAATATRSYMQGQVKVGVRVLYYKDQTDKSKLVSSTNNLVVPGGKSDWAVVSTGNVGVQIAQGALSLRAAHLRGGGGVAASSVEPRLRVWQVYWVGGRFVASDAHAKLHQAAGRLLGRGDEGAVVFFYTPELGQDNPDQVLGPFAAEYLSAWAMSACPWWWNLASTCAPLALTLPCPRSSPACGHRPFARTVDDEEMAQHACGLHRRPEDAGRGGHHHRGRAHAGGRSAHPGFQAADRRQHQRRPPHEEGRGGGLRVHRLPRRHRRGLHPGARARIRHEVEAGLLCGLLPERINPGDKEHTLTKILKIVSGDTPETLEKVAKLYERIIVPGVHRASSIKAAEAAKVIENTQRDLNIALMNELAIIFDKMGIDTTEVLEAAGTKWNFLKFKPGLVGGHCIGVDPYYLTHKAEMLGYNPQVILAGRRINDGMGKFIAEQTIKHMIAGGSYIKGAKVNVLGLTFKENCGDLRNSKVIDIINELRATASRCSSPTRRPSPTRPCTNTASAAVLGRPAARRCHRGSRGAQGVCLR